MKLINNGNAIHVVAKIFVQTSHCILSTVKEWAYIAFNERHLIACNLFYWDISKNKIHGINFLANSNHAIQKYVAAAYMNCIGQF